MIDLQKMIFGPVSIEKAAEKIVEKIAHSSFRFFKDEKIREMLNFSEIDQVEQDRIFNELVVTGLSLAILITETISGLTRDERSITFEKLGNELAVQYPNWLGKLGIEKQYLDIWTKLIEMRCDEYREDFKEYRKHLPDPEKANPWVGVIAIGGLRHIRRGKTSPDDPLFKHLLAWTGSLAVEIEKISVKLI